MPGEWGYRRRRLAHRTITTSAATISTATTCPRNAMSKTRAPVAAAAGFCHRRVTPCRRARSRPRRARSWLLACSPHRPPPAGLRVLAFFRPHSRLSASDHVPLPRWARRLACSCRRSRRSWSDQVPWPRTRRLCRTPAWRGRPHWLIPHLQGEQGSGDRHGPLSRHQAFNLARRVFHEPMHLVVRGSPRAPCPAHTGKRPRLGSPAAGTCPRFGSLRR